MRRALPLLAAGFVGLAACESDATDPAPTAAVVDVDYQISIGYEFISTHEGVRSARVRADSVWQWQDSAHALLFGMEMEIFDSIGAPRARVTSQEGTLEFETQELVARGNAVLRIPADETSISSPVLTYSPQQDRIVSDTVTRAVIGGRETTGSCFESDLRLTNLTVCRPVGAIPDLRRDSAETGGGTG
jgi:LPS export ABC transporter protein LptC